MVSPKGSQIPRCKHEESVICRGRAYGKWVRKPGSTNIMVSYLQLPKEPCINNFLRGMCLWKKFRWFWYTPPHHPTASESQPSPHWPALPPPPSSVGLCSSAHILGWSIVQICQGKSLIFFWSYEHDEKYAVLLLRNPHFSWKDDELFQTNYNEVRAVAKVRMLWEGYKAVLSKAGMGSIFLSQAVGA